MTKLWAQSSRNISNSQVSEIQRWDNWLENPNKRNYYEKEREIKSIEEMEAHKRVTRLWPSHVTWNQVHGLIRVGSQLCSTLLGSESLFLKVWRAFPTQSTKQNKRLKHKKQEQETQLTWLYKNIELKSKGKSWKIDL